jgi:GTP pyrophosphokinase
MTELKLDQETIMTALLHDTVEDTLATVEEIERLFGPDVARLVDGVTKLSKIETMTESERAAENLRKFLLAMSEDLRVLLVKLADRLHNMRTLHFIKSEDKRRRIARETMEIYAPLAQRVGMYEYMREMQLLAFEQLEPEAYATIEGRLTAIRAEGGGEVDDIALRSARRWRRRACGSRWRAARSTPIRSGRRWPSGTSRSSRSPISWPSACSSTTSTNATRRWACFTRPGR